MDVSRDVGQADTTAMQPVGGQVGRFVIHYQYRQCEKF